MNASHTPGPWFTADWSNDDGDDLFTIESHSKEKLSPGQSSIWPNGIQCQMVASTQDGSFDRDVALANARLIAAAPALLEALQAVVKVADRKTDEFDLAHAAIAKATGGGS